MMLVVIFTALILQLLVNLVLFVLLIACKCLLFNHGLWNQVVLYYMHHNTLL